MALHSDSALQILRLKKQENSLQKVHKYEQIADKLISGELDGKFLRKYIKSTLFLISDAERDKLQQEYRIVKNQLNYHLFPLRQDSPIVSWNSQMLTNNGSKLRNALDLSTSNSLSINDFQLEQHKKKYKTTTTTVRLPKIENNNNQLPPETQSDYGTEYPSTIVKLPPINN